MTMQHGPNKGGPMRDDAAKEAVRSELQAGRSTRADDSREAEPPGEDQPEADLAPGTTLTGGTPPGMTPDDVGLRNELARHLGISVYPAQRNDLLRTLRENNAPDRLVDLVSGLPAGHTYENVQEIMRALGFGTEAHRT
ncbi:MULTISPECIES: DUF2795 domain-containing protein [unclassified Streptomyces]|uniref:DUF2795 domain-containing protein n=1 Tax=unclassified Streptomyces TaxID=2593676 RepID=UPI0022B5FC91|nr:MULTISPECIES: DUF2795 domain-containing protein [unclassified Streptomyces]MCZ7415727.1 DUF2795 domain-containing protein [Streptomyces sp. WMMC897]MCZ7434462.1 DUF2795 domain-containing protein [Streptomyces sp. WMMC1477]